MQQQQRKPTNRATDVRLAGMAYCHGLHTSEKRGRAEDIGHGLFVVQNAAPSCDQT